MTAPQRDPTCEDPRTLVDLVPIDDAARNGRFQLVVAGEHFAIVRWHDGAWRFSSGALLTFKPEAYQP